MKKINFKGFIEDLNSLNPREIHNWPLWANVFIGFVLFVVLVAAGTGLHLIGEYDLTTSISSSPMNLLTCII